MAASYSIVFLGASGAVGGIALQHLANDPSVHKLSLLSRKTLEIPIREGMACRIVDTVNPATYEQFLPGHETAICTMGVGEPSKVAREEFIRIDHDAVLDFARACRKADVKHFILLGSVGADATSKSFYLQSKGRLRDAIEALGFDSVVTFQPSVILTPTNRYGLSQAILLAVWPLASLLLFGPLSKFKGIEIATLGKAIAKAALSSTSKNHRLHWSDIQQRAGAS
jgi:uncharacterized protein YbjT (DUF2867 family)